MKPTYSESWYQVAQERVGLLPTVRIHKQTYRHRIWYVLQDSCSEKYFRISEIAYLFVASLRPEKTVDEHWSAFVETHPDEAPSQDEVIQLLSQLHQMNLLLYRSTGSSQIVYERFQKQKRRERLQYLMAFLYFRLPLWNPNGFLKENIKTLEKIFSPIAFAVWCIVIFMAAIGVIERWPQLAGQAQGILAVDNLIWLYAAMFVLKICHEMGHAIVCRKYGGDVHNMGVMFIALAPLPYIDASASWSLRSRWQRAEVGGAGMYVELFFAALGALVWSQTGPGFVNSMAFNIMVIGSISSLMFNGNPLLKFDAYYILSDVIDIPNLYQKSSQQWFWLAKKKILQVQQAEEPAEYLHERRWFYSYGVLSFIYRLFVMVVILLYMADISLVLGVLMLMVLSWMWVISPLSKLIKYLTKSPELHKNRARATWATFASIASVLIVLTVLPVPHSMVSIGVVQSSQQTTVFAESGGVLSELLVTSGEIVKAGDTIMVFDSADLFLEYQIIGNQLVEVRWLIRKALESAPVDLPSLRETENTLLERLDDVEGRLNRMTVVAEYDGVWISHIQSDRLGTFVSRSERLGTLMVPQDKRFVGVIPQDQINALLVDAPQNAKILLVGDAGQSIEAMNLQLIPYQRHELPSSALGIPAGGKISAQYDSQGRMISDEPFFEVHADLPLLHSIGIPDGALGYMRIRLQPKSLVGQTWLTVQQVMQSRYGL